MAVVSKLIEGYKTFYKKYFMSGDPLYKELLAVGQSPMTLIIACSDSRVDPSILTTAKPGDIFVVRNVANIVPPYEKGDTGHHGVSAALEFAIKVLNVEHIVVLGHSNCAGIQTLLHSDKVEDTDFIGKWVDIAKPAREKTLEQSPDTEAKQTQHMCEKESIMLSLDNLLSFPWITEKVKQKKLQLHGWYFALEDGGLYEYDPKEENFLKINVE